MANYCPECGHRLKPTHRYCPSCGAAVWGDDFEPDLEDDYYDVSKSPLVQAERNKTIAAFGWITLVITVVVPFVFLVPLILGAILASRDRVGTGVVLMVLSVVVFVVRLIMYAQTGSESAI